MQVRYGPIFHVPGLLESVSRYKWTGIRAKVRIHSQDAVGMSGQLSLAIADTALLLPVSGHQRGIGFRGVG
jgi:hypothetical protein